MLLVLLTDLMLAGFMGLVCCSLCSCKAGLVGFGIWAACWVWWVVVIASCGKLGLGGRAYGDVGLGWLLDGCFSVLCLVGLFDLVLALS